MSRKDTIIVAVLVNAGLLIVLFASALKSDRSDDALVTNHVPVIEQMQEVVARQETPVIVGDEVDRALQQFAAAQQSTPAVTNETVVATTVDANSFVEDLKSIATTQENLLTAAPQNPTVQTLVAPLKEQKVSSEFINVTVKKGDVLEKIARHNHSSVAEIMKANQLKSTNLRIGQVLKVPSKTGGKVESTVAKATLVSDGQPKMYTVKTGDSPWTIAVKNQMKVEDLLKLNNMNESQAKRLKPGDKLRIQ